MFRLIIFTLTLTLASASLEANWLVYKKTYNKVYTEDEDAVRRLIWQTSLQKIEQHNELYAQGLSSFYLGENQFADMTTEEMNALKGTKKSIQLNVGNNQTRLKKANLPDSIDWRQQGYVTEVRDQLHCGSCYAFSAAGAIEGQHFKATGQLVSLSESQLVDCSQSYGNQGCKNGDQAFCFNYIIDNKGIDTYDSYPYTPEVGACKFDSTTVGATISSYTIVDRGNEDALQEAVAGIGPISVTIDDTDLDTLYKGGVYDNPDCSNTDVNHAMLAVGYGSQDGKDYWIVKNSWGPTWGESGYVKMSRNKNNQCGIATHALYPVV